MSDKVSIDFETKRKIHEEIKKFNRTEQEELFRILKRCSEEVSENRNGIFFDLLLLKDDTILKIQEWIQFCSQNNESFTQRETAMSNLLKDS